MYNHREIEKKWQEFWEKNKTFKTENISNKKKFYALDMFPYPSGAGLHVGHPEWYTANDIISRYKHAKGFHVLHPMGWDAFWLPAENYAIKTGTHPKITTAQNIATFKKQISSLGFSYDWEREIDTTNPKYYKWTQWIFAKMFEKWLAYEQDLPINFCPSCKTWLANEEVLSNGSCDRCGTQVEKKKIRQWVLAITKYADRLSSDVEDLDWPEGIKDMQRKWIGRSEGAEFEMKKLWDDSKSIRVYTTRIDTVFGMTYAVIAPDHKDIADFITEEQRSVCEKYIQDSKNKSDLDRTGTKEKTWVFSGSYVINPFNNEKVPVYIGDYVLGNYWTWALMAVPAHDERDFEFAKQHNLPILPVVFSPEYKKIFLQWDKEALLEYEKKVFGDFKIYAEDGYIIGNAAKNISDVGEYFYPKNNKDITDENVVFISSSEARELFIKFAQEKGFWERKVNYKLRDWLFSRQRYWGEPIPLIHLEKEDLKKIPHIEDISQATDINLAYILKRNPLPWEEVCDTMTCHGKVRELIIGGKVFSKIYDGIYTKIVVDYRLPLELPEVDKYEPSPDGQSPLARVPDFVHVKLADNLMWKRETNTMPQWGGSCWYYLRFMDRENEQELVQSEVEKYWGSVDSYVGGAEHAVLHLLYARFWHKFLYDIGVVSTKEPFAKLRNQGMILAFAYENKNGGLISNDLVTEKDGKFFHKETGEELNQIIAKMSKSLKNVVNPDDIVQEYGADTLRLYEMYMCDFKDSAPWDPKNIIWVRRFLDKVWNIFETWKTGEDDKAAMKLLHKTIKKVWEDIENYKFNTAISQMMILANYGTPKDEVLKKEWTEKFVLLLHPFVPHFAEELWQKLGYTKSIFFSDWPEYDQKLVLDDEVIIWVQVLGKLRWELAIHVSESKEVILTKARELESVAKWIEGKEIVKEIYVPWKIVNIVVK